MSHSGGVKHRRVLRMLLTKLYLIRGLSVALPRTFVMIEVVCRQGMFFHSRLFDILVGHDVLALKIVQGGGETTAF